jgi:hypothetical protein
MKKLIFTMVAGITLLSTNAQTIIFSEDFESGTLGNFTASGVVNTYTWTNTINRGADPGHSATGSAYFGNPALFDYNSGIQEGALLTSNAINLSTASNATLSINYFLETEQFATYDIAQVRVSTDAVSYTTLADNQAVLGQLMDGTGAWQSLVLDLSGYIGNATVYIQLDFNTIDGFGNAFEGFYVDDITVYENSNAPIQHTSGGNQTEWMNDALIRPGDQVLAVGQTRSFGAGQTDMLIAEYDQNGNMLWAKAHGTTENELLVSVKEVSTGGYIAAGQTQLATNYDAAMVRFDTYGNILWARNYGGAPLSEVIHQVLETDDGGFIGFGQTDNYGSSGDIYVIRTDANGNVLWTRAFGTAGYDVGLDAVKTSDGGYAIIAESIGVGFGNYDFILAKMNDSGTILWSNGYGVAGDQRVVQIINTLDGGFAICGTNSGPSTMVTKTDANGNITWSKSYSTGNSEYNEGIIQNSDGSYTLTGRNYNPTYSTDDISVLDIDNSGNVNWGKVFTGNSTDAGKEVLNYANGDHLILGYSASYGSGQNDIYFIRTDANGNARGCLDDLSYTMLNVTLNTTSLPTTFVTGGATGTPVLATVNAGFTGSDPVINTSITPTNVNCNGQNNGSADLTITGGFAPFNFQWSNGNTIEDLFNVAGGQYTVEVVDGNGCVAFDTTTIVDPPALITTVLSTDVTCYGLSDGATDLTVTGGNTPYNFLWSNTATSEDITGLVAGFYNVVVTDGSGCTVQANINVNQPNLLTAAITGTNNISCNGLCDGTATAVGVGGTAPITYQWDDPGAQATPTANGLCGSILTVSVVDANGCSANISTQIYEPTPLTLSMSSLGANCATMNGMTDATVGGGTQPYNYAWSSGGNTDTETSLNDGTYTVTITDDNGCMITDSIAVDAIGFNEDICVITVDSTSSKNVVMWDKPVATNIAGWKVYRDIVGNYTFIGYVEYDSISQFIDSTNGVNPNLTSYRYKITVVDTCGIEGDQSLHHETIHLTVNQGTGNNMNLIWDNYEGFAYSYYRILRDTIGNGNHHVLDSVTSSNFTYTDPNGGLYNYVGYVIEIVTPQTCVVTRAAGNNNTSRSNEAELISGPTGVAQNEIATASINPYPNPTRGWITIDFIGSTIHTSVIQISDIQGKLIARENIAPFDNSFSNRIDLSSVTPGMYYLSWASSHGTITKKIIVQ